MREVCVLTKGCDKSLLCITKSLCVPSGYDLFRINGILLLLSSLRAIVSGSNEAHSTLGIAPQAI
jgi:hypothetical protein